MKRSEIREKNSYAASSRISVMAGLVPAIHVFDFPLRRRDEFAIGTLHVDQKCITLLNGGYYDRFYL
jgi:hypothetical protein